jgi:hypothetical protein
MDIQGIFLSLALIGVIIFSFKNIREIIIPAQKSKFEISAVIIGVVILLFFIYFMGKNWMHYLVGFLGILLMLLLLPQRGITAKGIRSIQILNWGKWQHLNRVHVVREDDIKIYFTGKFMVHRRQYYDKENFEEIIEILEENLPTEILKID